MPSVNKVILIGALGRDPEVRYAPSGDAVANVSLATSEQWKDKSGNKQEKTEWHRLSFFGRQAEIVGEYLKKGSQIYVEGRLQTREWTDKEGQKRYTTEIVCDRMQMLSKKPDGGEQQERPQQQERQQQRQSNGGGPAKRAPSSDFDEPFNDDIPFASANHDITGNRLQRRLKRGRA